VESFPLPPVKPAIAVLATGRKQIDHLIDAFRRYQSPVSSIPGWPPGLRQILLPPDAPLALFYR
jgi:hypothetical protein